MPMLQACLNGARSRQDAPRLPLSPSEIAADALAVRAAGAAELHIHPRDADAAESLAPDAIAAAMRAVRAAVPGMPVGVSTGFWIAPGGGDRIAAIRAWTERPDYASVNLREPDADAVVDALLAQGVGIEAGIWTVDDAHRFVTAPWARRCLRILVEMPDEPADAALDRYAATRAVLDQAGLAQNLLAHGENESAWPLLRRAIADGVDTRIGLEDTLRLPDGQAAAGNADLVSAAAALGA